jgi:WD40 repeat protein
VSDRIPPDEWRATDIEVSPDATHVAAYDLRTKIMEMRDAVSGALLGRFPTGVSLGTFYSSDAGKRVILYGNTSHSLAVWDVESRSLKSVGNEYNVLYKNLAISGDGNRFVAAAREKSVRLWDVRQEQALHAGNENVDRIRVIGAGGDAKRILIRGESGHVRLIDTSTGRPVWEWSDSAPLRQAELSVDGEHILCVKHDGTSAVLKIGAGSSGAQPVSFKETAGLIALGADGKRALAVSQDSAGVINHATARVWDASTGEVLQTLSIQARVFWASLSRDGTRLLLGDRQSLWTWKLGGWFRQNRSFEIGRNITAAAVSPDGSLLAVVSGENILEVWDIERREQMVYIAGGSPLDTVAFAPDGRSLLLVSRNPQGVAARRLLLQPDDLIAAVCARVARNLTAQEWADLVIVGSRRASCPEAGL